MKALLLENIRSAHNVGSIFRTADGSGATKLFLGGYTPAPIDRFGRVQPEIRKTSLGASETVSWERLALEETTNFLNQMKTDGVTIVALEQTETSIPLKDFTVPGEVLYVVGNEVDGVSTTVLDIADTVVEIPMLGQKESLNVAVATGILLYHGLA